MTEKQGGKYSVMGIMACNVTFLLQLALGHTICSILLGGRIKDLEGGRAREEEDFGRRKSKRRSKQGQERKTTLKGEGQEKKQTLKRQGQHKLKGEVLERKKTLKGKEQERKRTLKR